MKDGPEISEVSKLSPCSSKSLLTFRPSSTRFLTKNCVSYHLPLELADEIQTIHGNVLKCTNKICKGLCQKHVQTGSYNPAEGKCRTILTAHLSNERSKIYAFICLQGFNISFIYSFTSNIYWSDSVAFTNANPWTTDEISRKILV